MGLVQENVHKTDTANKRNSLLNIVIRITWVSQKLVLIHQLLIEIEISLQ
jgi:hypothetical protein